MEPSPLSKRASNTEELGVGVGPTFSAVLTTDLEGRHRAAHRRTASQGHEALRVRRTGCGRARQGPGGRQQPFRRQGLLRIASRLLVC